MFWVFPLSMHAQLANPLIPLILHLSLVGWQPNRQHAPLSNKRMQ
jgi:hypothetical protein